MPRPAGLKGSKAKTSTKRLKEPGMRYFRGESISQEAHVHAKQIEKELQAQRFESFIDKMRKYKPPDNLVDDWFDIEVIQKRVLNPSENGDSMSIEVVALYGIGWELAKVIGEMASALDLSLSLRSKEDTSDVMLSVRYEPSDHDIAQIIATAKERAAVSKKD